MLLAARTLVPVATVTTCAVLLSLATSMMAWAFLGDAAEVVVADIAGSLGRIALVIAFGSVLSVGLGLLLRSTAGSLTAIFCCWSRSWWRWETPACDGSWSIAEHLPGHAVISLLMPEESLLPSGHHRGGVA